MNKQPRRMSIAVRIPADVLLLDQHFDIRLEPPYWYMRCWTCRQTWFMPWDPAIRTRDGMQKLLDHGRTCCPRSHFQWSNNQPQLAYARGFPGAGRMHNESADKEKENEDE